MADKKISALTASSTPLAGTEVLPIVQSGSTVKVAVSDLTTGRAVSMSGLTVTGQTASLGPGGTGASNAVFTINGSSASSYGPYVIFQRNSVSQWFVGTDSGINGGTSDDLILYSASNNLRLYNDVRAMNGNIVIGTAAKGIDFSANTHAAGMTSELLNDYEEGTWTPVVTPATGAITTYTASGNYTKIGRQVTVNMNIIITTNGTGASALLITGLPFNAATTRFDAGVGREYQTTGNAVAMTFSATNTVQMLNYNNTYPGGDGYRIAASITYNV
jgi:hypothetical protein